MVHIQKQQYLLLFVIRFLTVASLNCPVSALVYIKRFFVFFCCYPRKFGKPRKNY